MNRLIVLTKDFEKKINSFIAKNKLDAEDFEDFKRELAENPELGDVIPGTGGVRKIRLKSSSKGKSGGFRICYFDRPVKNRVYLIVIYPKNEQEDITTEEKKYLKELTTILKAGNKK